MAVEFGASIKLDSKSALEQLRQFTNASNEGSRALKRLQAQTKETAQGLSNNLFRKYINDSRKANRQTERAIALIHDQTKTYKQLTAEQKQLISTVDRLNQKYDDSARAEAQLTQVRKELRLVTAAGLKTQKEAELIYEREAIAVEKSTVAYKKRQAEVKKEASIVSAQKKRLHDLNAKYNEEYNVKLKLRQATKELNRLRRSGIITEEAYTRLLAEQKVKIKQVVHETNRLFTAQSNLAKAARFVSIYSRVFLGLYAGARLATFWKDLEQIAQNVELLDQKLQFLTGDQGAYKKFFDMTQEVGINMEDASKIMTRFAVVTNRAFSVETMSDWSATLIKSARATGTSTQEMSGALIQITQAMSAGRLMGDEYRSVTENLPLLTVALRDMFGKSTMSLKELSSQGLLTNDVMIEAFGRLKVLLEGFPDSTQTIEAAFGRLQSAWENFVALVLDTNFAKKTFDFFTYRLNVLSQLLERFDDERASKEHETARAKLNAAEKNIQIETERLNNLIINILKE